MKSVSLRFESSFFWIKLQFALFQICPKAVGINSILEILAFKIKFRAKSIFKLEKKKKLFITETEHKCSFL